MEINSDSLIEEKIQSKIIPIKRLLKKNNLKYEEFKINKKSISFKLDDVDKFELIFYSKEHLVNPYIDNYRSFELDYKELENRNIEVFS